MKKLNTYLVVNFILSGIFTILNLSFTADVSLTALPLSLIFSGAAFYFVYLEFYKKESLKLLNTARRFMQYEPFILLTAFVLRRAGNKGCSYFFDLITVLVWIALLVFSCIILYWLSEKRVYTINKKWEKEHKDNPVKKAKGGKRIIIEILEWIDALIQAAYTILLLNIFIFQLYEIPSESMVPEFLIKDRVAVFKTFSGPKFPLSEVGIPYIRKYKRGDIVVLRNPHYANDRKNEVKTVLSNFVSMLTLTKVQINRDENGEIKADPLVKRVAGEPGEQLMMMDGNLYARTKDSREFKLVKEDSTWAAWDLNGLSERMKRKIELIPLKPEDVESTLEIEKMRRELDLVSAKIECESLANEFHTLTKNKEPGDLIEWYSGDQLFEYNLLKNINEISIKLLSVEGGAQWFEKFINSWTKGLDNLSSYKEDGRLSGEGLVGGDLYSDANFRLNIMTKLIFARIVVRNAQLASQNVPLSEWKNDVIRNELLSSAEKINGYCMCLDQRNMPVFPSNDADGNPVYIPENCFFMMGDNRYNSLDLRHSYTPKIEPLTPYDELSVRYYSNIAPQYVNKNRMLGKATYRFWPLDRAGVPGKSNRK